jgi:two-component system copper resistance phosphate regulon response regulator CusR
MRVLIIEDEPKVALFIEKGLNENGYITDIAYDGVMGKKLVEQNIYNAIILDVNLPLINGYELCAHIRTFNKQIQLARQQARRI